MLNFKKLTGVSKSIKEAEEYREAKELLKSFAKYLPTPVRLSKWVELDKEMADRSVEDLPDIFQRVNTMDFSYFLKLCPSPIIKPWELISPGKIKELPIWEAFGKALTNPSNTQHKALVLFRLNRLGIWVMHNMSPPTAGAFVCIPAQVNGGTNITIEPLNSWAERTNND